MRSKGIGSFAKSTSAQHFYQYTAFHLLPQQEPSVSESIGNTEESSRARAGDAQDEPQRCIDAAQAHLHLDLLDLDERVTNIRGIPHKGKKVLPSTVCSFMTLSGHSNGNATAWASICR